MKQAKNNYDWNRFITEEQQKDYYRDIEEHLTQQITQGITIYPSPQQYFHAFHLTPFDSVKVVIIGQDPYHNPDQAHGLCFSVPKGVKHPPSLKNIFKAIDSDVGKSRLSDGDLTEWAKQGVLLLNSTLSVEAHKAGSHSHIGWQRFTDHAIELLNHHPKPIIFLLWGKHAQKKALLIRNLQHLCLTAPHPSPLSAHRGFLTCQHFSKANSWLIKHGRTAINW